MSPKTELPPELGDGYELMFVRLQRMFRARGVPSHDAADLAQEAAARLIVHLRRRGLNPNPIHEGINALIHRIAMNLLIDRARAGRNDPVSLDDAMEVAGAEDPADVVSRQQRVHAVRSAVAGLSHRHRRAIALSLDGMGPAEIAIDFGIERNAADALLYRARRRLAESLRLDQIGVAIALAVARLRATMRRSEIASPVLNAAPVGMHLATGIVGLAMAASFGLPPVDVSTSPISAGLKVQTATEVTNTGTVLLRADLQTAPASLAPSTKRESVSVTTRVPGSKEGSDPLGVHLWRENDGKGTTGPLIESGMTAACSTGSCEPGKVLR